MYLWMRAARRFDRVDGERHVVYQRVRVPAPVPVLPPEEIAVLRPREPFLPREVQTLDDRSARHFGLFQQIRHGGTVAERVHGPSGLDVHAQVVLNPLVTCGQTAKKTVRLNKNTLCVHAVYTL